MAQLIAVTLDRERRIEFTHRALFRMGTLPAPFDFDDLSKPRKSYAALVAWIWACLSQSDASAFASPDDLAAHIPPDRERCSELAARLADAINAGAESVSKNVIGSTPETLRSSS